MRNSELENKKVDDTVLEQFLNELYTDGFFCEDNNDKTNKKEIPGSNTKIISRPNECQPSRVSVDKVVKPKRNSRKIELDYDKIFAKIPEKVDLYGKIGKVDALRDILNHAITKGVYVTIIYTSSGEGKLTRVIKPLKVYSEGRNWYCRGYCYLRNGNRDFNLKKIHELTVVHEKPAKTAVKVKSKSKVSTTVNYVSKRSETEYFKTKKSFKTVINDLFKILWFLFLISMGLVFLRDALA